MPAWLENWWPVILLIISLIISPLLRWGFRSGLATREDLAKETVSRQDLAERVSEIEIQLKSLPSQKAVHDLTIAIEQLKGALAVTNQRLDGFGILVARVEDQVRRHETIFADGARVR